MFPQIKGLRCTPSTWQKLMYFLYKGNTEITGFGILNEDLVVIDFKLVKQLVSACTIEMDGEGMTDYLNEMMDQGIQPNKCFRIWIHTHPGNSPNPSSVDETQFNEFMEKFPWIVMAIIARDQSTYCRLGVKQEQNEVQQKFGLEVVQTYQMPFKVDWSIPCEPVDFEALNEEYTRLVTERKHDYTYSKVTRNYPYVSTHGGHQTQRRSLFRQNYENIEWKGTRPKEGWHTPWGGQIIESNPWSQEDQIEETFGQYKEKHFEEGDDEVDIYFDYLKTKPFHQMSEEEFQDYQALVEDHGDEEDVKKLQEYEVELFEPKVEDTDIPSWLVD